MMETITLESYPSSKCHHFWPHASSWYWYIWCYSLPLAGRQLQKLPFDQLHRDVTGLKAVVYVPTVNLNQLYQFQYGLDPLRVFKDPVDSVCYSLLFAQDQNDSFYIWKLMSTLILYLCVSENISHRIKQNKTGQKAEWVDCKNILKIQNIYHRNGTGGEDTRTSSRVLGLKSTFVSFIIAVTKFLAKAVQTREGFFWLWLWGYGLSITAGRLQSSRSHWSFSQEAGRGELLLDFPFLLILPLFSLCGPTRV